MQTNSQFDNPSVSDVQRQKLECTSGQRLLNGELYDQGEVCRRQSELQVSLSLSLTKTDLITQLVPLRIFVLLCSKLAFHF